MKVSLEEMESRLVRYKDLKPCTKAFIDTRTPGSNLKENFSIIGPGVTESADQHIHIRIPHGFNIGGARQPKGTINSQHSHLTEEVFFVHTGRWAFRTGSKAQDGEVILGPGDVISIPTNVFRGFECVSDGDSFLFGILGGDDPGHVAWAPYVFEQAKDYGLVLTESGMLIDTGAGEIVPDGEVVTLPMSDEEVATFDRVDSEQLANIAILGEAMDMRSDSAIAEGSTGVTEAALLGPASAPEKLGPAPLSHNHGFHFRRIDLASGASVPAHARNEEEVMFVHKGQMDILWGENRLSLGEGDILTVPIGLVRSWECDSDDGAQVLVVRGGDAPSAIQWA